ncbi:MAG: hypothetical protein K1X94_11665 [Sandaracinaceae bacterium]|nr:hypothetical protein [Sandaracinaceae bacterium]
MLDRLWRSHALVASLAPLALVAALAPTAAAAQDVDLLHAVGTDLAVSSTYRNQRSQADALIDGDLETAWNSRTGELTTSWIEVRVPATAHVSAIAMTAGFTHQSARADLFTGNHRVRRVRVSRDGVVLGEHTLDPQQRGLQSIPVSGPGGVYRVEIVETLPGSRTDWREICISELRVMGTDPGARPGQRIPRVAVGTLPAPRVATPPDRAAVGRAHRQRVAAFERSWISIEQLAESPRVGSAPDEEQWPSDMQELARTRRTALTALADFVTSVDEVEGDALRARAALRVPLEWQSGDRERMLVQDLEAAGHAMDVVSTFLGDDESRCRWARSLGLVYLTRAAAFARGDASLSDQSASEMEEMGERLPRGEGRRIDSLYSLGDTLSDAEREWSRNTRGVAARLHRVTPPAQARAADDLARVMTQVGVCEQRCGWPRAQ